MLMFCLTTIPWQMLMHLIYLTHIRHDDFLGHFNDRNEYYWNIFYKQCTLLVTYANVSYVSRWENTRSCSKLLDTPYSINEGITLVPLMMNIKLRYVWYIWYIIWYSYRFYVLKMYENAIQKVSAEPRFSVFVLWKEDEFFPNKARLALCFISNLSLVNQQYEKRHFHE